ncbi:hypothetical protein BWQ96_10011 [Gracilariopsis chorda]|uniref:Uncharacterized protein n=1 Tax=Gracilariopsis chorda TaxID=448386 RepID=A0A2V3IE32_9FLOR|nr:hypothetical protein BWQ96_10011 [Gracilariopsis chorda]|eukprot:PXF40278.1 hypothetical protein BWQ96_10011 [Gracilariopsis chorda]
MCNPSPRGDEGVVVPAAFRAAAARWASGTASAEDTAAMLSVTAQTPLPSTFDALRLGFDPHTRLPTAAALPLFNAVKNDARTAFHVSLADTNQRAILKAINSPIPAPFPSGLHAAPARRGLAAAAKLGLYRTTCVQWTVSRAVLESAGVHFIGAAHEAGFEPSIDVEGLEQVLFTSRPQVSDSALRRLYDELMDDDFVEHVLPPGAASLTHLPRAQLEDDDDDDFDCTQLLSFGAATFLGKRKR